MPNPLPSDQRRFAAESPFDAAFGYGSAPISTPTSEGRHDSSQTAGRAADEDGLQPADTPAELTGPVWVVDDDDVRESLTFALQPRFEAASYPTLEAFLTQADLMQPGCLVIADRFAGLNESSLDEFNVQHELELRRSPVDSSFKYCRRPFISTDCVKQAPQPTTGLLAAGRCVHRTARTGTAVGIKTALMVRTTIHHACTMMEFHAFEHILLFG